MKSADKIVQMQQTWFREFTLTTWFKKAKWVGKVLNLLHILKLIAKVDLTISVIVENNKTFRKKIRKKNR